MKLRTLVTLALVSSVGVSCSKEKSEDAANETTETAAQVEDSSQKKAEIDGSSKDQWSGFDFDGGRAIGRADFPGDGSWDIAVKRTSIKVNAPAVKILLVKDQAFDSITSAASEGYVSDQSPSDPAKETTGFAFHQGEGWYSYDPATHVVKSRDQVYLVQSSEGRFFKLKILDYYNVERLPGFLQVQWQELATAGAKP